MKAHLLALTIALGALNMTAQEYIEAALAYGVDASYGTPLFSAAGGISCVDFTGDGLDDLTIATSIDDDIYFYVNQGDGTFLLLDPAPISNADEVKGLLWIDYDNDGDLDFITAAYGGPNRLYQNTGNLNFVDVTIAAGLPVDSASSMSVSAADYDRDGDLDLYICNYGFLPSFPPPPPDTNFMYRNNGDGTFTDVTGFTGTADSTRQSWCATFFDYNNDGWEDLYVANDRVDFRNALYHNNGDGTFTDVSAASGTDITIDAMNAGIGDYDNNGFLDIYVTNTPAGSVFLHNNGDGTFTDVADSNGTKFLGRIGWGGNFYDFDHDLDLDLYVSASSQPSPPFWDTLPNGFFINNGLGNFSEPYASSGGLQGIDYKQSHCNALGDFNNDGYWDIAVSQAGNQPFMLWEHVDSNANFWFKLTLQGTQSNRNAIGTWIEVWINGQKYIRTTHSHQAFWAQNSNTMVIGTGSHDSIDSLVLRWPYSSGGLPYTKQVIPGCAISMFAVNAIVEGQAGGNAEHIVTTNTNDGVGSFRQLIANACSGDTIRFDATLANDTIGLEATPVALDKNLIIMGDDAPGLIIRINDQAAAWNIPNGVAISMADLQIEDGAAAPPNPMISNQGSLTLEDVTLISQSAMTPGQQFILSTGTLIQRGVVEIFKQ